MLHISPRSLCWHFSWAFIISTCLVQDPPSWYPCLHIVFLWNILSTSEPKKTSRWPPRPYPPCDPLPGPPMSSGSALRLDHLSPATLVCLQRLSHTAHPPTSVPLHLRICLQHPSPRHLFQILTKISPFWWNFFRRLFKITKLSPHHFPTFNLYFICHQDACHHLAY